MNEVAERVLTNKIEEQEGTIKFLIKQLKAAENARADYVVKRLRHHGTILLHVGSDYDAYQAAVREDDLGGVGETMANDTWSLGNAPVDDGTKVALMKAAEGGMNRW